MSVTRDKDKLIKHGTSTCDVDGNFIAHINPYSRKRSRISDGRVLEQFAWLQKLFIALIEKLLEKSSTSISRRPFHVIGICILFTIAILICGLLKMDVKKNVENLLLSEDSVASHDIRRTRNFGFELEFRREEVIILPKRSKFVLSQECLAEIIDLHNMIIEIPLYEKHCFRSKPNTSCVTTNLLEIFYYEKKNLVNISGHIKTVLQNNHFLLSNGRRLRDSFNQIFGKMSSSDSLDSTNALRIVYFMQQNNSGTRREEILNWENTFIEKVSSFSENTNCSNIYFSAERSLDDSISESTSSDVSLFGVTLVIMAIFISFVNGRCANIWCIDKLMSFSALISVCLGISAALGFLMFLGVPVVSTVAVMPFLVIIIEIQNVLIILQNMNEMAYQNIPAMHMLIGTMARSGPIITMTTLTNLIPFVVSNRSLFPAIRFFCTYSALAILSAFFMLVTFFVSCMWCGIKRISDEQRKDISSECCHSIRKSGLNNAMRAWGEIITSYPGKVVVCFCSLLLLCVGIYGTLNIDNSYNIQSLIAKDSLWREFLNVNEEHFHINIEVNIIFPGQMDYSSVEIQQKYFHVYNIARKNKYLQSTSVCWLSEFLRWTKAKRINTNDTRTFYQNLHHFISLPEYRGFAKYLKFSEEKSHLTASRIVLYSKSNADSSFQRAMMVNIPEDLSRSTDVDAYAVALPFIYFEQHTHVLKEIIRNVIVAGIFIFLISYLFLSNFVTTSCLLCGFVAHILELLGLMYFWNVSLNSLSMIYLVMALGFSVNNNARVAYHFLSSKATSPEFRVIDALSKIGGSVFIGGLCSFLGIMPTIFASSEVFNIFFKMYVGIILLDLLHGLVILPVYLTVLGEIFENSLIEKNVDSIIYKLYLSTRKNIENKIRGKTGLQRVSKTATMSAAAVVGISCRFPGGANSKSAFWDMLVEGRCGIGQLPTDRPYAREFMDSFNPGKDTPGKHYVFTGAFLDNVFGFDNRFFGISTTECRSMDPQQRILLQVVYEAIEDAGIRLEDLQQCKTGVYVGLMNSDHGALLLDPSNIRNIDQFASTGSANSIVANRISFSLNLTGPSLTVDTACSSSLTAFDIAFAHLKTDECDVAIVCGSNILLTAKRFHTACCRTGLLAQDGRCKSFDIKGDGYGRGEGVAAVVFKPTKTALEDRDDIYAEVVACGMNNDGQTAIPITAPSEGAQAALFQRVLHESGLPKDDVQYIEAHGTGTAVGDVVEMGSLSAVYGYSSRRILRVGSVKSNINHTESTAGLAGLIKTCLMIKYAQFVPSINVHEVKPQLKMSERKMMVQVRNEPWNTEDGKPRTAAVSSYGFGGANAHVIIREVNKNPATVIPRSSVSNRVMTLSAASKDALREMARNVSRSFKLKPDDDELLKDNICYSLNERYTVHSHRLAVSFSSFNDAAEALEKFADQEKGWEEVVATCTSDVTKARNKVVFLYGGQGARWYGMAREMLVHEPKFKESIERIDSLLKRNRVSWSLIAELSKPEEASRIHENAIGQTALFAIHFALTELLKSWGVVPSAVVGNSLGEISAAWASGALDLYKALQLVLFRSQLHEKCSSEGCMISIGLSEEHARRMLQDLQLENQIDIAILSSPGNVVLSGDKVSIAVVENHLISTRSNIFWKNLATTRAYHSREMEEIKQSFIQLTNRLELDQSQSNIPFYSTVTGTKLSGQFLLPQHWWKNIRQPVLLEQALKALFSDGYTFFVEIDAAPQLSYHVSHTWSHYQTPSILNANEDVVVIQTLPKRSANQQHLSFLQNCVAHLFTHGIPLSWNKVQGSGSKSFIRRPNYPWQETEFLYRGNYPSECVAFLGERNVINGNETKPVFHPLLGKAVPTATFTGLHAWESEISLHKVSYINDHKFIETPHPVIPAAVYVEIVLAMSLDYSPNTAPDVHNIGFNNLLTISNNDSYRIRTRLLPKECPGGENHCQITIVEDSENEVILSKGSIKLGISDGYGTKDSFQQENMKDIETLQNRMIQWPKNRLQKELKEIGLAFGPQFNLITQAWSNSTEALALIRPTQEIISEASAYVIHPSVIDACFQTTALMKVFKVKSVPQQIKRIIIVRRLTHQEYLFAYVKLVEGEKKPSFIITLIDCFARPVMVMEEVLIAEISEDNSNLSFDNASFQLVWQELVCDTPAVKQKRLWLILRDQSGFAEKFSGNLPNSENVKFVDRQDNVKKTRQALSQILDEELVHKRKGLEKIQVINFWPVDANQFDVDLQNFEETHSLTFESCLLLSQEILRRESIAKNIQLVFVTSEVVSIENLAFPADKSCQSVFPWSGCVFGLRRTVSEEMSVPKACVVDLPRNPSDNDFRTMVQDVSQATMEEEIVYRNGVRYVNRIKKLNSEEAKFTKQESPVTEDGVRKPFKLTSISEKLFLQKISNGRTKDILNIEVLFASPILHKPWEDMKMDDRIVVAGKLCSSHERNQQYDRPVVVGVCKFGDLGSYVAADRCCYTEVEDDFTAQQASSLCYPMAMSYHILKNLLNDVQGNRVLVYHHIEEICCIFACVAKSLAVNIVCLIKNRSCKDQISKFGNLVVLAEDEIEKNELLGVSCMNLDAVCFLDKPSCYVLHQITKHLKRGASVVTIDGNKTHLDWPFVPGKGIHYINTSLESIPENSEAFSKLLGTCISALKSRDILKKLLSIPQLSSSLYDVVLSNNGSKNKALPFNRKTVISLHTISLKPNNIPQKVEFYRLPLDSRGFKQDRTYLVIGGVRGFGFEVARWMVENGAKTVICTARTGPSEEKKAEVQRLEKQTGSSILLRQADVTSWKDMDVIKGELERLPAVAGIVFTAMILEDQLLQNADLVTCKKVVGTKVKGSILLHQLSLSMDLDFFIMFSSISAVLGNIGQVSYAAANTFLDHLCEYRRHKLGLPALSVNWGPISGTGVLERNADISSVLQKRGFVNLHYTAAMEFLKRVLLENSNKAQVCISPMDWQVYLQSHSSPRLQMIRDETLVVNEENNVTTLEDLALQPLEFRVNYVQEFIQRLLSSWSGADVAELDLNVGLHKYGVDSIAATNMKLQIKKNIGATFETYYFIQPKTSGLSIINDVLEQIQNISTTSVEDNTPVEDNMHGSLAGYIESEVTMEKEVDAGQMNNLEIHPIGKPTHKEKVIPLYSPDEAVVKVFMVHGSQKSALALASFALGFQQQTLVALYGIGVDETSIEKRDFGTVPILAKRYVDLVKKVQLSGPYYLAGFSFGGTVAYEMASELTKNNETVAMVFMVDTFAWFPKALTQCREFFMKCAEMNLNSVEHLVTQQMIEKLAFVRLGTTQNEMDSLYQLLGDNEEVMKALEKRAEEKNLVITLKEEVDILQYELRAAAQAHTDWQPSKECYEETLTYVCCDEKGSFPFMWSGPEMWKSLAKRTDLLYVSGSHLELQDETRGKICGSLMMTTAAMKYQSTFSTLNLQVIRSRPQERLMESIKQGMRISLFSSPSSLHLIEGALWLDSQEKVLSFEYKTFGFHKVKRIPLKDLSNIFPGKHVDTVQRHHGTKPYIDFLLCMLTNEGMIHTFRCADWQQLHQLTIAFEALFGIPFMKIA